MVDFYSKMIIDIELIYEIFYLELQVASIYTTFKYLSSILYEKLQSICGKLIQFFNFNDILISYGGYFFQNNL